jgi:glucose-6-phosphate 1-dehydrogenase
MAAPNSLSDCMIVIFGASGDLTKRKLIPALYDLFVGELMPEHFAILGISRTEFSDDAFRDRMQEYVRKFAHHFDEGSWREFSKRLHYHAGDSTKSDQFGSIKQAVRKFAEQHQTGDSVLFYLSLAPSLYDPTIVNIGAHDMVTEGKAWCSINREQRPWQRIIVEKPFGHDLDSAAHLNRVLGRVFEDESIYRIDHFLGKETVQNLLVFRFANAIFEPIWKRNYIDHVQITAAETMGVEGRGGYYDSPDGGAMRDMIQSHLLQLMALVAMEPPVTMRAEDIRAETNKVLTSARQVKVEDASSVAVRGQYGPGHCEGESVVGYRQEEGVDSDSRTETYAAMKVQLDTWRWHGVPFYLRSGKRLPKKTTEIVIYFHPTPHCLFAGRGNEMAPNQIVINVQPDEGIRLRFEGKVPGIGMKIKSVVMDFDYAKQFKAEPAEAYATLLLDAMRGDQTNFKQRDEIERAWQIVQPVLDAWERSDEPPPVYPAGSWGPAASDELLAREGRHWRVP